MKLEGEQKLVRVFIGEQDRWNGVPLYQAIVDEARALGLAGATAVKGFMGYGCKAHVHTAKLLELSYDLPIVVEIVDTEANVKKLLPKLSEMVTEGLVTMEKVHVILYRADKNKKRSSGPR
ncbi:MAG: DUF190 domain-containing protein [Elusimicrobia bacterium]|nr:DUF190 domain-containing protein [Elusimicrobiota bacterium]